MATARVCNGYLTGTECRDKPMDGVMTDGLMAGEGASADPPTGPDRPGSHPPVSHRLWGRPPPLGNESENGMTN